MAMCNAKSVKVYSLNGLGAAGGCSNKVTFPFTGVLLFNTVGGTLPDCVWNMNKLEVLHLVGNGLTGTLIHQLPNETRIIDLSLSHNRLKGAVPLGIQRVKRVDLSYNQISSKYSDFDEPWTQEYLDLEINRLSGQLPVSELRNVSELKVLRGNMYSCNTIPSNDEFESDYLCGSADLNESYTVLVVSMVATAYAFVVLVVLSKFGTENHIWLSEGRLLRFMWRVSSQATMLFKYLDHVSGRDRSAGPRYKPVMLLCSKIQWVSRNFVQLLVFMLLICLPVYILRGSESDTSYSTHKETYMWFATFAYLRGVLPATLALVAWAGTLCACYCRIVLFPRIELASKIPPPKGSTKAVAQLSDDATIICDGINRPSVNRLTETDARISIFGDHYHCCKGLSCFVLAVFIGNAMLSIFVNAVYIYAIQQPLSQLTLFGVQSALALYRLLYSYIVLPFLVKSVTDSVLNIRMRFRLTTVSNLIIPCAVTLFGSLSCFQVL